MSKGFTLVEVIIYIALFSLLMGTAFVTAYGLIDGISDLHTKNMVQEEGSFVMRKLNWALTGADTFSISGSELTIHKYDGTTVMIKLGSGGDAEKILMDSTGSFLPITTENVKVTNLQFQQVGSNPIGISATTTVNSVDFVITKYKRI